jgi:prolyl-tRNA synthetase
VLGVETLRWATEEEIKGVGAVPGYASPIGTRGATVIVDDSIINSPNLVAGANKTGYHFLNTNVPRDYKPDVIADIALAHAGDPSPDGSGELELVRGAQIGALSAPRQLDAGFLDLNGKGQKQLGVALTIDLGAALLAHIAAHHDDKGILWSRALAPFDVHIIVLNGDKPEVAAGIKAVSDALERAGLEAIMDDRNESAGVKFNDADLLGLPLRITAGPKTLAQGAVEFKPRTDSNARLVPLAELDAAVNEWLGI